MVVIRSADVFEILLVSGFFYMFWGFVLSRIAYLSFSDAGIRLLRYRRIKGRVGELVGSVILLVAVRCIVGALTCLGVYFVIQFRR